jgi:hypothetical protein
VERFRACACVANGGDVSKAGGAYSIELTQKLLSYVYRPMRNHF